jgi:hypothetical protein
MGLFSRRTVQRLLQENRQFLTPDKVGLHKNHLNGTSEVQRLTTQWEVAVLNGLSKLGRVEQGPILLGNVSLDLLFTWKESVALIDITTVSDRGLDEANPVGQLCNELIKKVQEHGLDPEKFTVSVEGNWRELYLGGPKPTLFLPPVNEFDSIIFDAKFQKFLAKLVVLPQKTSFKVKLHKKADVTISFDPAQQSFSCSHLSYTVPFTTDSNTIHNRLKSKAVQLGKAGFAGWKGIILCDAGCNMLTRQGRRGLDLGGADIILAFLNQNPSIAFVIVLSVESDNTHRLSPEHLKIVGKTYVNGSQRNSATLFSQLCQELIAQLPRPETTPINALDLDDEGKSFWGGGSMAGNRIKISARTVAGILAGRIPIEKFVEHNKRFAEQFASMLDSGRTIAEVRVEKTERDDDWIEFLFSDRDPAISPFKPVP